MKQHQKYLLSITTNIIVITCLWLLTTPIHAQLAPVEVTGQTQCWELDGIHKPVDDCSELAPEFRGQDGYIKKTVPYPEPQRFIDNHDGTVTDKLTGLIWLQDLNCFPDELTWLGALQSIDDLRNERITLPPCRLDKSARNRDWRLPNIKELQSLVDFGFYEPALSNEDGTGKCIEKKCVFSGAMRKTQFYWSSTSRKDNTNKNKPATKAWGVKFDDGRTIAHFKSIEKPCDRSLSAEEQPGCTVVTFRVWPVYGPSADKRISVSASATVEDTGQQTCWDPTDETRSNRISPEDFICYDEYERALRQDGAVSSRVALAPERRFSVISSGTVKDNLTGLVWLKNANCFGKTSWQEALRKIHYLNYNSDCGSEPIRDGNNWRLPNVKELQSLIDFGQATGRVEEGEIRKPALPKDHPFEDIQVGGFYWSSTTVANPEYWDCAWTVSMNSGLTHYDTQPDDEDNPETEGCVSAKSNKHGVWPVRGGAIPIFDCEINPLPICDFLPEVSKHRGIAPRIGCIAFDNCENNDFGSFGFLGNFPYLVPPFPECIADGIGCYQVYLFYWPKEAISFDLIIAASSELSIELIDEKGQVIAKTEMSSFSEEKLEKQIGIQLDHLKSRDAPKAQLFQGRLQLPKQSITEGFYGLSLRGRPARFIINFVHAQF